MKFLFNFFLINQNQSYAICSYGNWTYTDTNQQRLPLGTKITVCSSAHQVPNQRDQKSRLRKKVTYFNYLSMIELILNVEFNSIQIQSTLPKFACKEFVNIKSRAFTLRLCILHRRSFGLHSEAIVLV